MNRNFEFKQLLRAFRSGIIDEGTFESELGALENGSAGTNGTDGHRGLCFCPSHNFKGCFYES